uniref:Uncharacterized protein n=1 Tax=Cannabis sativa TaxID=3483 RepID=A0A803PBE3_CANSA
MGFSSTVVLNSNAVVVIPVEPIIASIKLSIQMDSSDRVRVESTRTRVQKNGSKRPGWLKKTIQNDVSFFYV